MRCIFMECAGRCWDELLCACVVLVADLWPLESNLCLLMIECVHHGASTNEIKCRAREKKHETCQVHVSDPVVHNYILF